MKWWLSVLHTLYARFHLQLSSYATACGRHGGLHVGLRSAVRMYHVPATVRSRRVCKLISIALHAAGTAGTDGHQA